MSNSPPPTQDLGKSTRTRAETESTFSSFDVENESLCRTPARKDDALNILASSSPEIETLCQSPFEILMGHHGPTDQQPSDLTSQLNQLSLAVGAKSSGSNKENQPWLPPSSPPASVVEADKALSDLCFEPASTPAEQGSHVASPRRTIRIRGHRRNRASVIGSCKSKS